MVFYFQTTGGFKAYMGRDKFENDQLIAHGWPEDIWFHVDKFSSAHVYLRLPRGPERKLFRETGKLDHMPEVVKELCALTKANSIEGSKQHEVTVSYTPWENLQKRADMDAGTIGFKDMKAVMKVAHVGKEKDLVKALEQTQTEDFPDLPAARAARDKELQMAQKTKAMQEQKAAKKAGADAAEEIANSKATFSAAAGGGDANDFLDGLSGDSDGDMDDLF